MSEHKSSTLNEENTYTEALKGHQGNESQHTEWTFQETHAQDAVIYTLGEIAQQWGKDVMDAGKLDISSKYVEENSDEQRQSTQSTSTVTSEM